MSFVGLADCNTFYASCERVFRPDLKDKPIVVLSNNDGCIVALSKEAKALGIKRGIPYFEAKPLLEKYNVAVFSSNYTLYQDLSDRVMEMLNLLTDGIEIYSIDECFFHKEKNNNPEGFAASISKYLKKGLGLPVSVAMARTKTLAKIANHIAKKGNLSFVLHDYDEEKILKQTPVDDVWGIGWRSIPKCLNAGIKTAWDFANLSDDFLLKNFTVTGYNTAMELRGFKMIGKEKPANLSVSSSISFDHPVCSYSELYSALACHCTTVCDKLSRSGHYARFMAVQILTNRFADDYTNASGSAELEVPSSYIPDFVKTGERILNRIFNPQCKYKSLRIIVWDLCTRENLQMNLFDYSAQTDSLNRKDKISGVARKMELYCASTNGMVKSDLAKRNMLSPMYTTSWDELPAVGKNDLRYSI